VLWYAPLLVAWDKLSASKAVFFSAAAALINWRAFIAYGVAVMLLFGFVLMLALGGAMLFGGSGAGQANSALFAVVWTLLPVWFASSYLSYRDIFDTGEAAKSSTIPP
jgi:NADH:ubiquinone oxidoreductase subunit 6 (subunit J)